MKRQSVKGINGVSRFLKKWSWNKSSDDVVRGKENPNNNTTSLKTGWRGKGTAFLLSFYV